VASEFTVNNHYVTMMGQILTEVANLDVNDPQERDTPRRFLEALREMTSPKPFEFTSFELNVGDMIVERGINFSTLCKHHLFPFMGVCHIGYVPNENTAGLSKLPRLVEQCSRHLNTQEELTAEIANEMESHLAPRGVAVVMEAQHTCMSIRGARAHNVTTRTATMRGVFADHSRTAKLEFLEAIR
jgi:GTP cyclohydrolase I